MFARASSYALVHHEEEDGELEAAALAARAVRIAPEPAEGSESSVASGVASMLHLSRHSMVHLTKLHRPSQRSQLLHSVSKRAREASSHDDDTLALLDAVRRRFDAADVPLQDVLVRGAPGWREWRCQAV